MVTVNGLSQRSVYGAQNILILGSQTRDGQRAGDLGTNPSLNTSNSDNLLLVHLNPTHTQAIVLSIPRDTMVYEPGCQARRMTALKATPAAQNLLAAPAPQTGQPGPVTLVIGTDFLGVNPPAAPHRPAGHVAAGRAGAGGQATVQSRNAGASICSGLPAANPDPGTA